MGRTTSLRRVLSADGIFVAANLLAGGFNYLYQVVASRELSAQEFSDLNAWYAHLAIFFMLGGLLQYTSNFYPARRGTLKAAVITSNLLLFLFFWAWTATEPKLSVERGVFIVLTAMASGWLMGQLQIRQRFAALATANFVLAASRLGWLWSPWPSDSPLEHFSLALLFGFAPAFWVMSFYLWSARDVSLKTSQRRAAWLGPLVLSGAGALMPQLDLLVMHYTQAPEAFTEFARASLFYKAIYFLLFIVAQLALPKQLHGQISRGVLSRFPTLAFGALAGSAILAALSPAFSRHLLGWGAAPDSQIVFLSCLHMSLLTLIFFWIQEQCARHKPGAASAPLVALGIEALAQWGLRLPIEPYLYSVIGVQCALLVLIWRRAQARASS